MSQPNAFPTSFRSISSVARSSHRVGLVARFALIGLCISLLGACRDMPSAPQGGIDRSAAGNVMPAVIDARLRVAAGLSQLAVRQRVVLDLSDLEIALRSGNSQNARAQVQALSSLLEGYRGQSSVDGAEVSAIFLVLHSVSQIVDPGNPLPL